MKRSLVIMGLITVFSIAGFGQTNKKTNQNPASQRGSQAAATTTKKQTTTSAAKKAQDDSNWNVARATVRTVVTGLMNTSSFADDNTFRLLIQKTTEAHAIAVCQVNNVSNCNNNAGEVEGTHNSLRMQEVRDYLNDAKQKVNIVSSSSNKTKFLELVNRAIELSAQYMQAHPETNSKDKSNTSTNTPPIDESTKTKNGQNPIANGTTNSTTSNSTQKTTNPNSGFMDYTDDAVKGTPKSTKNTNSKVKNNKTTKKTNSDGVYLETVEDLKPSQTNNLGGDDDPEKTQRSSKTANNASSKAKSKSAKKPTNNIEVDLDWNSAKQPTTKKKKTTPPTTTTPKKP